MIKDTIQIKRQWTIERYSCDEAYLRGTPERVVDANGQELPAVSVIEGNLMLNEGIQLMLDLLIGAAGTPYSNANAYLGVGDSSAAEGATQTGLQAASNKTYKAMEAAYPARTNQSLAFQSVFGADDANYAWNEFTVVNGNSDAGVNLNRKVSAQGTKASGQVWTLTLTLTVS